MLKKAMVSAITLLLSFFLAQSLVYCTPINSVDTLIPFTPKDLTVSPDHETVYLVDGTNMCLVAVDLQTGQTRTLALPYTPTKVVYAGASIYVALSTPDSGADSVAVVDLATFTAASTIPVDLDISGLAGDANYLYVYNSSKIESFDISGTKLSSLAINNLYDVKIHPTDGNLYGTAYGGTMCLGSASGQLSMLKQNSSYTGSRITLLPDGKNLILSTGVVLTCNSDASKALVLTKKLQSGSSMCTDASNNELYVVTDRLIQVYDASTLAVKRVLAQPVMTNYMLFSSGKLIVAQKDSTNNLVFRAVDPGALLSRIIFNGDAISELYPLQFSVDGGSISNATASVDISATPALAGAQISGDIGTVPLAVGKNTLSISVQNTDTGNTQTYTVTITRAAKDFPAPAFNAFTNLGFVPTDFELDSDGQVAYLTASSGYSLFRVDMTTGKITEKQFTLPAERLVMKNGNIYVTLLRSGHTYSESGYGYGAIAIVDADSLVTKSIFNTNIDPYDLEADNAGYLYVAPGSNQTSIMASYDSNTGAFVSSVSGVYYNSAIELNPVSGKLYSVTKGLSPAQMYAYEINNGAFIKSYGSPYWGTYSMAAYQKISPDGNAIFNGSGCIFTSTPALTGDMIYAGTLGSSFTSICFNLADQEFYTANGKTLKVYDYDTHSIKNGYALADPIVNMACSEGKITLLQQNASQQYYIRSLTIGNHAADLASLGVSAGTLSPAFEGSRLGYSLVLPAGTSSVTVSPATLDSGASFTIDGNAVNSKTFTLDQGGTASVTITVQSKDKALLQSYTLFIYRQTADRTFLISPAFFTPTQQISTGGALYLAAKGQPFLYKFEGATGIFSVLPLPGVPNALGCAGNTVFAAMESTGTNAFSIGVIDTGTFTLADTFAVDTRFTGIRSDDDTIYAFTSSVVKGYARSNHQLAFSKTISSIVDVQPNPQNGTVYIAANYISSYSVKNGQLTLNKTNSNCPAQAFNVMPDGMHMVLSSGTVLRCSGNPAYDLVPEAVTLPNLGTVSVDIMTNELYTVIDSYLISHPYNTGSYLIGIYDASDFSYKRTISDSSPMHTVLGSCGSLYVGQKDSKGNIVLRASYSDTLLRAVTVDGDAKDGLYPLRSAVDAGEVPASTISANIQAVAVEPGNVITGDIGTQPLAVGNNVFSITVTNPDNGHKQTYSVNINRRSSDPTAYDAREKLGFTPLDVALDPDRQVEYMTASNCKSLYRVDLQTGQITEKTFSVPVERLAMVNGKLYATLLRTGHQYYGGSDGFGAVAVIDTATFATTAVFSTNIDPYDIAADDAGNVYLAPGSGQWSLLASYNTDTGALLSEIRQVRHLSRIDWNPHLKKIYLVTTDSSPVDITALETVNGVVTETYDSPYHGDYAMTSYERISPDGSRIFNGAGTMFACKPTQTGDMVYLGKLGVPFTSICFDLPNDRFYAAKDNKLTVCEYSTMKALNTLTFTDSFADLQFDGTNIIAVQKNNAGYFYICEINPDMISKQYTVSFNSQDGSSVASQTMGYNSLVTKPSDPSRTGYTFGGWYKEATCTNAWNFTTDRITRDTTLFAKWTINTYTVMFNSQGGSSVAGQTIAYNGLVAEPTAPARTGYTFDGWYREAACNNAWNFATDGITSNTMLYAKWTINTYTVTFNSQGGSSVASQTIGYSSLVTKPSDPSRIGYTFGGWYKEATCTNAWNFTTDRITIDTTLYAKWTINTYTVTFNSQGGSSVAGQTIAYNSLVAEPAAPARTGYTFGGWYKEAACTNSWDFTTDKVTDNVTLYAKWNPAALSTPATVKAVSASYTSIAVSWSSVATATGYEVWRAAASTGTYTKIGTTASNLFSNTGLITGTTYYYKVRACLVSGTSTTYSEFSSIVSAKPILGTPISVKAAPVSFDGIKVSWGAVTGTSMYEIYRSTSSSGAYTLLASTTAISYTNAAVNTGTTYYYKIRSYRLIGSTKVYGAYSIVVSAKTTLATPSSPKAASASYNSIQVTWGAVAGATKYEVYRATSSTGTYAKLVETSSLRYINTDLKTGSTYYFKVRAYRLVGSVKVYGGYSTVVSAKPVPGTPTVTAARISATSIKLAWVAVAGTTKYEVYRATSSTGTYTRLTETASVGYTNSGLTTGKLYYYKVRAYRLMGSTKIYGAYSAVVSAKP